jgi:hypothetical protein
MCAENHLLSPPDDDGYGGFEMKWNFQLPVVLQQLLNSYVMLGDLLFVFFDASFIPVISITRT